MQTLTILHTIAPLVEERLALLLCVAIFLGLVLIGTEIEGRSGDIEVALLDNLRHEAIEEGHDERVDVGTIDIGVGHDDNLIVAELVDVGFLVALTFYTEAYTDTLNDVHHRFALKHLMPHHLLYVEDLSSQGKDGLSVAVASLLGRTTGGVTLDEEDLAGLGVFVGAVGQLTGQSTTCHRILALHTLTRLTGSNTCCGGENHLVADELSLLGMLL